MNNVDSKSVFSRTASWANHEENHAQYKNTTIKIGTIFHSKCKYWIAIRIPGVDNNWDRVHWIQNINLSSPLNKLFIVTCNLYTNMVLMIMYWKMIYGKYISSRIITCYKHLVNVKTALKWIPTMISTSALLDLNTLVFNQSSNVHIS